MLTWPFQSDAAVLRKVRAGDHASFRVIVDRYVHVIRGVALAYLSNPHDADDVVQDTLLRAFEAREKLTPPTNLGAWLITVAKNRCFDLLRKRTRENGVAVTAEPATTPAFEREELYQVLWEHVSNLDPGMREVLMLHYFSRKSAREIAALLEITPDAAAKRLQRARATVGQKMVDTIGNELSTAEDRKRKTDQMMAVLGSHIPGLTQAPPVEFLVGGIPLATAVSLGAAVIASVLVVYQLWPANIDSPANVKIAQPNTEQASKPDRIGNPSHSPGTTLLPDALSSATSRPPAATPHGIVNGLVVDMYGAPLSGAEVTIRESRMFDMTNKDSFSKTTTTDAEGLFQFKDLSSSISDGATSTYDVVASTGNLFGMNQVAAYPWLDEQFVEITAYESYSLTGVIRDTNGNPVTDAEIMPISRTSDVPTSWRGGGHLATRSDAQGLFHVANLTAGVYELDVLASGYKRYNGPPISSGSENVEVVLVPNGEFALSGTIRDATGKGLADIPITGTLASNDASKQSEIARCKSGEDGAFALRNLRAGNYTIALNNSEFTLSDSPLTVAVGNELSPSPFELVVTRGATISGRVANANSGSVSAMRSGAQGRPTYARIDDDGTYKFVGLAAGTYEVAASRHEKAAPREIFVEFGKDYTDIDLVRDPMWSTSGTIVNGAGSPIAGAHGLALNENQVKGLQSYSGTPISASSIVMSDEAGRFTIFRHDERPVYLQAMRKGMISSVAGPESPENPRTITLTEIPTGSIEGEVVLPRGGAVHRCFLIAVPVMAVNNRLLSDPNSPGDISGMRDLDPRLSAGIKTTAGFSGRFRFSSLPEGTYEIHAFTLGMTVQPNTNAAKVAVDPSRQTDYLRIPMPLSEGGSVEGKLSMKGEPLQGQKVEIERASDLKTFGAWTTWTDGNGEYIFDGVQEGEHVLSITRYSGVSGRKGLREIEHYFTIAEGESVTLDFDLASGSSRLAGTVLAGGKPVPGTMLFIRGDRTETPEEMRAETDEFGAFAVDGISPGVYDVQVSKFERAGAATETFSQFLKIEVLDQPNNEVTLEITAGGMVGTVKGVRDGETAAVVLIPGFVDASAITLEKLRDLKAKVAYECRVEPNGKYNVMFVEPGTYTAIAVIYPEGSIDEEAALIGLRYQSESVEIPVAKSIEKIFDIN